MTSFVTRLLPAHATPAAAELRLAAVPKPLVRAKPLNLPPADLR